MNNRVTGGWKALKLINSIKCEADSYEKSYKKKEGKRGNNTPKEVCEQR